MTTAQQNAIAQQLVRHIAQVYDLSSYSALHLGREHPELSAEEVRQITYRVHRMVSKVQIPPELLQSEVGNTKTFQLVACDVCDRLGCSKCSGTGQVYG